MELLTSVILTKGTNIRLNKYTLRGIPTSKEKWKVKGNLIVEIKEAVSLMYLS